MTPSYLATCCSHLWRSVPGSGSPAALRQLGSSRSRRRCSLHISPVRLYFQIYNLSPPAMRRRKSRMTAPAAWPASSPIRSYTLSPAHKYFIEKYLNRYFSTWAKIVGDFVLSVATVANVITNLTVGISSHFVFLLAQKSYQVTTDADVRITLKAVSTT